MGNQQMAYSNHQPPPTVEDPNEWYDSVSEIDEHKEQVTAPGNNVVVNGILDELIDSLFESKLANRSDEDLPNQYSPGDEQPNGNDQTSPSTYDEVAPNWKGDASVPVSERSDSIPPGKFIPSSNNVMVCKDVPVSAENETQNLTNIRNTLKDATNESLDRDKLCYNVLSFISQEVTKEDVKELFVKSDPVIPLPCPEDCDVSGSATTSDTIKPFELKPRDVETISQSGKFCELFCDSKEISSFQVPLETISKSVSDNCDEDVSQDFEGDEQLNTNKIIRDGEKILEKTALYLEELTCNRRHDIEKKRVVNVTSDNADDPSELKLNVIPNLKQTIDLDNKPEYVRDEHNILEEAHLQEEVNVAPFSNKCYDTGSSLEHISSIDRALDVSQLLAALDPLTNNKFPEEINKFTGIKQLDCDIITRKQQDSVRVSDIAVGSTGRQDESLINSKDTVPSTNSTDVAQDSVNSKRKEREENNVGELDNVEAKSYNSAEIREYIINSEEKCNVLQPVPDCDNCANEILDSSSDISSVITTSETLQNAASTPSELSKDETIHLETEKVTEVKNSDNVNNIPLMDKGHNASSVTLAEDSETNSTTLSKDPESLNPFLQETEIARSFSNESVDEERREKLIEANSSVAENTNIPPSSNEKDTPEHVEPAAQISSVGGLDIKSSLLSSEDEKNIEVKLRENADSVVPTDGVSLMEENKLSHRIGSPTVDGVISCIGKEEHEKFQSSEKIDYRQNEETDRKHIDIDNSVTKNIDLPSTSISNDMEVPSNITQNKIIMESSNCNPFKSSLGITNVEAKPISPETDLNRSDNSNIFPIAEFSGISTSLVEGEGNPPFCNSEPTAAPLINTNMTRKPIEEQEIAKENSTVACPCSGTSEDISESTKKTDVSVDAAMLPKTKQSGCVYEERENIYDLDEVINQFRLSKHKSESMESHSKLDRRKELLDKLNTRKPTTDKRRNPEKNAERSSFQSSGERRKDPRVPSVQNKNAEETSSCSKNREFKLPSISRNEAKEQQISENLVEQKGDFVNFRGNPIGGEQQHNEPKEKSADVGSEVDKKDATNKGNLKKERMPELKPETLKSLIADLSLTKSTTDVGCNTADNWSKRDVSKVEADWLKERKKLVGRITNLHETQNATKFIVKELIFLVTSWMEGKDKDNVDLQEARQKLINERDQALEDLRSVEESFYELHRRYEKTKKLIEDYKKNEEILRRQISEGEEKLQQQKQMFDELVKHSEIKIEQANSEILNLGKSRESEIAVLTAQLRKAEMKARSLEKALEQKVRENTELSSICEDLITKCGRK